MGETTRRLFAGSTVRDKCAHGQLALIDGSIGVVVAPFGRLSRVLIFTFEEDKIARVDVIGEASSPARHGDRSALIAGWPPFQASRTNPCVP
jgi:hypothetical protein